MIYFAFKSIGFLPNSLTLETIYLVLFFRRVILHLRVVLRNIVLKVETRFKVCSDLHGCAV